jgi:beta-glucosidase-like glycosyl hydrolase
MMTSKFNSNVQNLLDTMTIDEKLAQLSAFMFFDTFWHTHESVGEQARINFVQETPMENMFPPQGLGFVSTQLRDLPPRMAAEKANADQRYIQENTKSKIPVIIHDEGVHGLIGHSATIYPSALGMSASWNPELMEQVGQAIGKEARVRGIRQLLSPTLNLGLDARNGRVEETYGEDPLVSGRMATAFVKGVQCEQVACTPKHFVANFEGDGGRDSFATHFSERYLREIFFVPFEMCVTEAKPWSLMSSYNTQDGTPCTGSHWLLTEVLRDEWGFEGYVVSDYHSLVHIWELHLCAEDKSEAAKIALEAGMDVELPRIDCYGEPLKKAIEDGRVSTETLNLSVGRILNAKFSLGMFDDPYVDPDVAEQVTNCAEHRRLAREMARQSLVLLKNDDKVLPLAGKAKKIALIGPNTDSVEVGDYSWDLYSNEHVVTPLRGIKENLPEGMEIVYTPGCDLATDSKDGFVEAVEAAKNSDVAVLFVGNSVKLCGEARDRQDLDLPGVQEELIKAIVATGTPVVVFVITNSIHTITNWVDKVSAVVHCWYAGEEGGTAMAEVLFGKENFTAKLPITIPRNIGQCPVYYFQKPSGRGNTYTKLGQDGGILFGFGHGLSYTEFEYSNLEITSEIPAQGGEVEIRFSIKNIGDRAGVEIPQIYLHDKVASVARPLMQLQDYCRIPLEPGEKKTVCFKVTSKDLSFLDANLKRVVEPGTIEVMVGASAVDTRLEGTFEIK